MTTMNKMTRKEIADNLKLSIPGLKEAVNNATDQEYQTEQRIEDAQVTMDNCADEIQKLQVELEKARQTLKDSEETLSNVEDLIESHEKLNQEVQETASEAAGPQ